MFDSVSVRASFIDTHIRSAPSETFTSVKSFERLINAVEIPVKSTIWDKELQQWPVNQPLPLGAFLLYLVSDSQTLKLQENNAGWRTHLICHGVHNNNKHFVVAEFRSYTKSVFCSLLLLSLQHILHPLQIRQSNPKHPSKMKKRKCL